MSNKFYFAVLLMIIAIIPASSAGVLKGKITDTKGDPLPFATVFIQGTTMGTSANAEAQYQLHLQPGTYKVLCQFMGFRQASFNVTVKGEETITHDFSLHDQALEMKTVVVKANAEDPAYAIIRKAIKRRQFHLEQVQSFQTSLYLKGVFRSRALPNKLFGVKVNDKDSREAGLDSGGKGVLYLCEQYADYYSAGGKERTVIRSVRESGDPNGFGLDEMPPIITFYANNAAQWEIFSPRGFISPISDNAIHYYNFRYEGEFREGKYTINKIKVMPKRNHEPLLQGAIYIVEDDWAIHSLDLIATKKSNLEFLDTLRFQQVHLPLKKDTWVIKSQILYPTIKFFGIDASGHFVTVYDKQKVNEKIPDTIFNDRITSIYEKDANKRDTSFWTENRPIPLEDDETRDYKVKDSLMAVYNDPVRQDSIRRRNNRFRISRILSGGIRYTGKAKKWGVSTNSIANLNLVNVNTVEGLNVAPKFHFYYSPDTVNTLRGSLYTRYGFSNTHFNAQGRLNYRKYQKDWVGRSWGVGIEGGKYAYQYNPQSALPPVFNTITTLVGGRNHMKLYERWNGAASVNRTYGNGLQWAVKAGYQKRLPLNNTTSYSWVPDAENTLTPNYPTELSWVKWEEHNAALIGAVVSYRPGYTYTQYPDYKEPRGSDWPLFTASYQKGIPNIVGSKSDFDKWRFSVKDDMSLKLFGTMSYDVAVGGFLNKNYVSLPDLMHLTDNEIVLAAPYLRSFQMAPYYRYSNTESIYGELHLEYYLKGFLSNKIPLLRQAKWYLVMGTNTFYASDKNYYTEAFAGIDNLGYKIYRFLRVDVVHSWDHLNRQSTGIRVGLNLLGLSSVSLGGIVDEEM